MGWCEGILWKGVVREPGLFMGLFQQPPCPVPCLSPLKSWEAGSDRRPAALNAPTLLRMLQVIALCLSCRYFDDLLQLKDQSRKAGAEFLSWNDIQDSVNSTNSSVQDENDRESCPHGGWACRGSADILGGRLHWDSSPNETPENLIPPWAVTPLGAWSIHCRG